MSDSYRHDPLLARIPLVDSGFYWWYRFMQYLPNYGPDHPLWDQFGDCNVDFESWMVWVFPYDGTLTPIREFTHLPNLESYKEKRERLYGVETVMLAMHPHYSRRQITKRFKEILDRQPQYSLLKRPTIHFHAPPKVKALRNTFMCYYLKQMLSEPKNTCRDGIKATNYEMLEAIDSLLTSDNTIRPGDEPHTIADKKNNAGATFARYIAKAKRLIHNIGEGRFPDYR